NVLRNYAKEKGIGIYSGDENNVASRYFEILTAGKQYDFFFRICGDSPFYDTGILKEGLELMRPGLEIITSMPNKGYPMGCNLEAMSTSTFLDHYEKFTSDSHREHVTTYFYEHLADFSHMLLTCQSEGYAYDRYKFSVDTLADFERAEWVLRKLNYEPWKYSLEEKLDLLDKFNQIIK